MNNFKTEMAATIELASGQTLIVEASSDSPWTTMKGLIKAVSEACANEDLEPDTTQVWIQGEKQSLAGWLDLIDKRVN